MKGTELGYIGEAGFPQNTTRSREQFAPDETKWANLCGTWFTSKANPAGLWVTLQGASEQYWNLFDGMTFDGVFGCPGKEQFPSPINPPPKVLARKGYMADTLLAHMNNRRGINFFGGQKWTSEREAYDNGGGTTQDFNSNANPGIYGQDYWYPTVNDDPSRPDVNGGKNSFQDLASVGVKLVRLGFWWERLQQQGLGVGGLDKKFDGSGDFDRYKKAVDNAVAAGLSIIIDCHNYGGYYTSAGKQLLGSSGCPSSAFASFWKLLSTEFKSYASVVGYDLMNEPMNDPRIDANGNVMDRGVAQASNPAGGKYSQAKSWELYSKEALNSIRATGDQTRIFFAIYGGPASSKTQHPQGPWVKQGTGSGAVGYTVHHYFDHRVNGVGGGGVYDRAYGATNPGPATNGGCTDDTETCLSAKAGY